MLSFVCVAPCVPFGIGRRHQIALAVAGERTEHEPLAAGGVDLDLYGRDPLLGTSLLGQPNPPPGAVLHLDQTPVGRVVRQLNAVMISVLHRREPRAVTTVLKVLKE